MVDVPHITSEIKRVGAYPSRTVNAVQHNAWLDALALMEKPTRREARILLSNKSTGATLCEHSDRGDGPRSV